MASPLSGPLAKIVSANPDGARLTLLRPVRPLARAARIWLYAGLILAVALMGFVFIIVAFISVGWHVLLLIFAGMYVVIVLIGMSIAVNMVGKQPRRLELRMDPPPAQVAVVSGWRGRRSEVVAVADLSSIAVNGRTKLGHRSGLDIVLRLHSGKEITCEADIYSVGRVTAKAIADWLEEQLGQAAVTVWWEDQADREFQCPEQWWPRAKLASLWDVPEGRVSAIAAQRNVRSYTYTPREFAMYSMNKTVTVYDPGRAYEVAKEFHSERSAEKA
jgi:hypothetical protein